MRVHGSRIRILHCLETVGAGGVEQRRLTLAKKLDCRRYEQRLLCYKMHSAIPVRLRENGVSVHAVGQYGSVMNPAIYRRALSVIREFKPHIIHGAVFGGVAMATIAGRIGRVPIVVGEETSDPLNRKLKGHLLYRALAGQTDMMVAISPAVEQYLTGQLKLHPQKVRLINNGVDWSPPESNAVSAVRAQLGIAFGTFVIGTVGRLNNDHKRQSDLINAFELLHRSNPDSVLLVVGGGANSDGEMLKALVRGRGLSNVVHFVGYQADPRPYVALMDVFALASAREAFGLVLVEAMLAGVAVVATRVGGVPFVLDYGKAGVLVDSSAPSQMAAAFLRLLNNPNERKHLANEGQQRAQQFFTAEQYVASVHALYEELLEKKVAS